MTSPYVDEMGYGKVCSSGGGPQIANRLFRRLFRRVKGTGGVKHDVVSSEQLDRMPKETENWRRHPIESLPLRLYEMDQQLRISFTTHKALFDLRYSQMDLDKGLSALDLIVPEEREVASGNLKKLFRGEKVGPNKYTALRKDGSAFPVIIFSRPIRRNGMHHGLRGLVMAMSEEKAIGNVKDQVFMAHKLLTMLMTSKEPLPICVSCQRIEDNKANWYKIDTCIQNFFDIGLRKSICPECSRKRFPRFYKV